MSQTSLPDLSLETDCHGNGYALVAGVDEVGRGPWAGPVVAAAVILDAEHIPSGLNDSKKLSAKKRDVLFETLVQHAHFGIGIVDVKDIDRLNILQASLRAMHLALTNLPSPASYALIDGNKCPEINIPCKAVVKGDGKSLSIAAASIVAKVTRDRIMQELGAQFPGYGWERNMGYGTKEHQEGLAKLGVNTHHRRSFAPIRKCLDEAV